MDFFIGMILEEEQDDDDVSALLAVENENREVLQMFENRSKEGVYNLLVLKHLSDNDTKFKEFFRLTPQLFYTVLHHIKDEISTQPTNKHPTPISPEEKLCLALR